MSDGHTGASVVVVDAKSASELRHQLSLAAIESSSATVPDLPQLIYLSGVALTVPYTLRVVVSHKQFLERKTTEAIEAALQKGFQMCDATLNSYNKDSEISLVNSLPVNKPHAMSEHLFPVMECVVSVYTRSSGAFDPSVAPIAEYCTKYAIENNGATPQTSSNTLVLQEFKQLLDVCNLSTSFSINIKEKTISRRHVNAKLDLGSISKGYTVDYIVGLLEKHGFTRVLFDWGGEIKGLGRNLKGEKWVIAIPEPPAIDAIASTLNKLPKDRADEQQQQQKKYIRTMALDNEAVATSGDYGQAFVTSGGSILSSTFNYKQARLIAPRVTGIAQATVKSTSCMFADALSTASLVKEHINHARQFLETWRYSQNGVLGYCFYSRKDQIVARMNEIATENESMKKHRISLSLPARVIVVGGGLAGLCAVVEAVRCGASVVLIEKERQVGGNSAKATSGINGWGTNFQALKGVMDDGKYFERDTFLSGVGGHCDFGLVKTLSVKSREAIHFLAHDIGIPLSTLFQLGGHSRPRTHRVPDKSDGTPVPVGYTIIQSMLDFITREYGSHVTMLTSTLVTSLIHQEMMLEDDESMRKIVKGVRYRRVDDGQSEETELQADSVILACGGFGNDHTGNSLLHEFAPALESLPTTNGPFATGDGVKMAREIGASLIDMEKVQLHPTGFINPTDVENSTKYLGPEALRGSGGILINTKGQRFVNELGLRSFVSDSIKKQNAVYPGSKSSFFAWCVLGANEIKLFGSGQLAFYKDKIGLFRDCANVTELAKAIDCPENVVKKTLTDYAEACKSGKCPLTRKTVFPSMFNPAGPFVVAAITPVIHYCMGGIMISPSAEVQTVKEVTSLFGSHKPILGLFAAGEVTGGVHGQNRLGGNSLLECVVFGRIAGDRAATILQKKAYALSTTDWVSVVLREVREGTEYGQGIRVFRFNLPGALQRSGLQIGQYVAIQGEWDGQQLLGYYSPITLPQDYGVIGILARVDKGTLSEWMSALRPGDAVQMKAMGGLVIDRIPKKQCFSYRGHPITKIGMIAGGTGVAPMVQIMRAALKRPYSDHLDNLQLIYAAETYEELTFMDLLDSLKKDQESRKVKFDSFVVLNNPPPGWTAGVGFVDAGIIRQTFIPPSPDLLVVICGPPVMQAVVKRILAGLNYDEDRVTTVDQEVKAPAKL